MSHRLENLLHEAVQYHQSGQLEAAALKYQQILAHDARHADALHLLGLVHYARSELLPAMELVRCAVEILPRAAVFQFNLGNILRDIGDLAGALIAYRQAVALKPDEADYHNNLGQACEEAELWEEAIDCYHRAVAIAPADVVLWVNLALVLQQQGRYDEAVDAYLQVLKRVPQHAQVLNNLGGILQVKGDLLGAACCYQAAIHATPDLAEAHRNYGGLLEVSGDSAGALQHYDEALRLKPDYAEVAYVRSALRGDKTPNAAPGDYVAALFDQYAEGFDEHLIRVLGYRAPVLLRDLFERCGGGRGLQVFDLGCGTGLAGATFRDVAGHLAGVDLSRRMVEKARARDIYDDLMVADVVSALRESLRSWDLLVAADVLVYVGDLVPVFAAAHHALCRGGLLLFSVEQDATKDFVLREAGRYAHSPVYVRMLAAQHGFMVQAEEAAVLRQNLGADVPGGLYALRKV